MDFKIINKSAVPRRGGGGRSILRCEEEMKRGNRLEETRVSLLLLASSFGKAFDRFRNVKTYRWKTKDKISKVERLTYIFPFVSIFSLSRSLSLFLFFLP